MTPTLTNAQKYSPEFGFELGVVIAIVDAYSPTNTTYLGYFSHVADGELCAYTLRSPPDESFEIAIDSIKSIRLRSGPWSAWQFAPADAIGVSIDSPFGDVKFFIKGEEKEFDIYRREHWTFTSLDAPWWWLEGQK